MSKLILKYEVLVSGIFPFEGDFLKNGFSLNKVFLDEDLMKKIYESEPIYLSPYIGHCCYNDANGKSACLVFQKEETIDIEYKNVKEYDLDYTNNYLESLNLFDTIDDLEKIMILETGNFIKFPIKYIRVYDETDNLRSFIVDINRINVPSILSDQHDITIVNLNRQNNRLNSHISYDKISELKENNKYFNNALSLYYSSFSVDDECVGFVLLTTALESLLSLSTYSKPVKCESCNQDIYKIGATVSKNTSLVLLDDTLEAKLKKLYGKRSKFIHEGNRKIEKQDEQEMQEYVRKVLLMYWFASMGKKTFKHKEIIAYIQSKEYQENSMVKSFLIGLENLSFQEKKVRFLTNILEAIVKDRGKSTNETNI